jgi:hypothetical protein
MLADGSMTVIILVSRNETSADSDSDAKDAWKHAALSRVGIANEPCAPYLILDMTFGDIIPSLPEIGKGLESGLSGKAETPTAVCDIGRRPHRPYRGNGAYAMERKHQMVVNLWGMEAYPALKTFHARLRDIRDARPDASLFVAGEDKDALKRMAPLEYRA